MTLQYYEIEDIYITTLESLITKEQKKYLNQYEFIGIDFDSNLGTELSLENKKNILNYFRKTYEMDVFEVSLDEIERKEALNIEGFILKVDNFNFKDNGHIEFDSILYISPIAIETYSNKMKKEKGKWIVYDKKLERIT